ncbi:hypothetical protein ACFVH0_35955 [Streptomyces sp. NPDC127117]|uniref:hypothetical protein n=1 Tax=Streptomyces sp. NPDC127117 TaxID=3345368 RepID=UPI003637FE08
MPSLPPPRMTELFYDGQWNNISSDMRESDPVTITRGVSSEGNRTDPSVATATLDNRHGRYSPRNPLSPLFGKIGRNTPWRFSVAAGAPWAAMPGGATDRLVTPDAAALDVTGDLDLSMDLAADNWRKPQMLAARYALSTGNNRCWIFELAESGALIFMWSPDGTFANRVDVTSTLPVPAYSGQRMAVRVTLDVNNEAGGRTVRFYTARTMNGPWVQLGADRTATGTTALLGGTASLEVGRCLEFNQLPNGGFLYSLAGRVYGLRLRNGIEGAAAVNLDVAQAAVGATSWTDASGRPWSTAGSVTLTNRHVRMVGEVPAWPPARDLSGADATTPIAPAGIMRRLGAGNKPLDSALRRFIMGNAPLECWPLTDGAQATQGASLHGGPAAVPLAIEAKPQWSKGELADWIEPVMLCPTGTFGTLTATPPATGTASWSVDVFRSGRGLSERLEIQDQGQGTDADPRLTWLLYFQQVPNQILVFRDRQVTDSFTTTFLGTIAAPGIFDDSPHHIRFTTEVGASTTAWSVYIDGTLNTSGVDSVKGQALRRINFLWDLDDDLAKDPVSLGYITCWGPSGPTAADMYRAYSGFPGEYASTRMLRVAAEQGVRASMSGEETAATRLGIQKRAKLLDAFAIVAETDLGYALEQRDARALIYRGRDTLYNQEPVFTLDYSAGLISAPFKPTDDDKLTENDVTVVRDGGGFSTAVLESGRMSVLDPPEGVGRYDVARTLSLETDAQTADHAYWRMHLGTYDGLRYTRITINLGNPRAYALIDSIYRADVGDLIRLTNLPADHPPDDVDLIVRGYTEEIGATGWTITFNCAPGSPWTVGVMDDPTLGRADTEKSQLTAAVSATATVLSVGTTTGPVWTADPGEAPWDITAGGEVMTVVGVGQVINPNPLLATGTSGWIGSGGSVTYSTAVANKARGASASLLLTPAGTASPGILADPHSPVGSITPGASYTMCGWVYSPLGWPDMRIVTDWYTSADVLLSTSPSTAIAVPAGVWTYISVTATAPATASRSRVRARQGNTPTAADISYWWGIRLIPDASVTTTSPQQMTVVRSINGIVKAQLAGTDVRLAHPTIAAL